jgi:cell division septal protein FtsQ
MVKKRTTTDFKPKYKKHRKDFNWNIKEKNPFHIDTSPSPQRTKILLSICVITVCSTIGILLYHPFFRIRTIEVTGLVRISESDFVAGTEAIIDGYKAFIIPRDNYFFLSIRELQQVLITRFILEDVSIIASFPDTLSIAVQEKISTIIYDNGEIYAYMGIDGKIIEEIRKVGENEWFERYHTATSTLPDGSVTSTRTLVRRWHIPPHQKISIELGDYPILYDQKPEVGNIYQFNARELETILQVRELLMQEYNISTQYISTLDDVTAAYYTNTGVTIFIDIREPMSVYQKRLQEIQYNIDIRQQRELDLRYGNRVYVR